MITIDKAMAEQLYDLYHNVEAADAHYKRCQSDNFRVHIKSVYQNDGVRQAFESLRANYTRVFGTDDKEERSAEQGMMLASRRQRTADYEWSELPRPSVQKQR